MFYFSNYSLFKRRNNTKFPNYWANISLREDTVAFFERISSTIFAVCPALCQNRMISILKDSVNTKWFGFIVSILKD